MPIQVGDVDGALRRMLAGKPVIVAGDGSSHWTLTDSSASGNTTQANGGDIFTPCDVRLFGTRVENNEAPIAGGGIHSQGSVPLNAASYVDGAISEPAETCPSTVSMSPATGDDMPAWKRGFFRRIAASSVEPDRGRPEMKCSSEHRVSHPSGA
jgi:hypothetical protein